ncbi:polygalacturonase 1 beta-like protein 2 [Silene latifolia]|uniref:polygalacturonase 1 beta-like protein 2 n=1 Tax=Silene latifolia TaxID=37657 RepID=UPI003D76CAB6
MKDRHLHLIAFLLLLLSSHVAVTTAATSKENPFTPKAAVIRYWNNKIYKVPRPGFLINKASPLTASDSARFAQLAATNSLSAHLSTFCNLANLLCFPDPTANLAKHSGDDNFAVYSDQNFTNYATVAAGGTNDFKNYSPNENEPLDSFRRYSRDSAGHNDDFTNYASGGNVISQTFNTYAAGATGGTGQFTSYAKEVNVPGMQFTSYSDQANGRDNEFNSYSDSANAGDQGFANYGKNGNGASNAFAGYGKDSNVVGSTFTGYSVTANAGNNSFTSYGFNGNVPQNKFTRYGDGGNAGVESFTSYRDQSNVGDDAFTSYGKDSNIEKVDFTKYRDSFNVGSDNFTGYGESAKSQKVGFKSYGQNSNFKAYAKKGINFADYKNGSSSGSVSDSLVKSKMVKNKWVEPGKFFRESELKEGKIMPMPDIRDKMPKRSFLPRGILTNLPFSSAKLGQLKEVFHGFDNSSMEKMLRSGVEECERVPSPGETKKCVGSIEDMIDFAVSVLGRSVEPRTTQSVNGSKGDILIGKVSGINGGKVTKSVSCHQSLFPYLLYYCHSVPKVRVYQADILDPKTKSKINHGISICHLDTSVWSPTHGAFLALGSGPGKIEVCHWIFENDLTWTIAD